MKFELKSLKLGIMLSVLAAPLWAGGLRSPCGMMELENLQIGQEYSMQNLAQYPFRVINTSDYKVDLRIEVLSPGEQELLKGYDIIPSTSWVKLAQDEFVVEPGHSALTDVVIAIPDDEKYLGKRYQFYLWSYTYGGGSAIHAGLKSKICFKIASVRKEVTDEQMEKMKGNLNFSVVPHRIFLEDIEVGKRYNLKRIVGKGLKIINPNSESYTYKLTSLDVSKSPISLTEGYEECPNPGFLDFKKPEIKVKSDEIEEVDLFIKFPKKEEYKGKKYMFVVRTEVLNQGIQVEVYSRIYVETRGDGKDN